MMGKKYELVAWTKNITDEQNARLYVLPSVEIDLLEPLITEVNECHRLKKENNGYINLELARRFIKVYEQSARLDIFTGHIGSGIRFLLQAADYCIYEELLYEFEKFCKEAIALTRKHGFEYILQEERPKQTLDRYLEHLQGKREKI